MLKILSAIIWIFSKSFQLSESIITKGLIRLNILHVLIIRLLFKSIQKRSNWIVFPRAKSRKCSNSMKERSIDRWILDQKRKLFFSFLLFVRAKNRKGTTNGNIDAKSNFCICHYCSTSIVYMSPLRGPILRIHYHCKEEKKNHASNYENAMR